MCTIFFTLCNDNKAESNLINLALFLLCQLRAELIITVDCTGSSCVTSHSTSYRPLENNKKENVKINVYRNSVC